MIERGPVFLFQSQSSEAVSCKNNNQLPESNQGAIKNSSRLSSLSSSQSFTLCYKEEKNGHQMAALGAMYIRNRMDGQCWIKTRGAAAARQTDGRLFSVGPPKKLYKISFLKGAKIEGKSEPTHK